MLRIAIAVRGEISRCCLFTEAALSTLDADHKSSGIGPVREQRGVHIIQGGFKPETHLAGVGVVDLQIAEQLPGVVGGLLDERKQDRKALGVDGGGREFEGIQYAADVMGDPLAVCGQPVVLFRGHLHHAQPEFAEVQQPTPVGRWFPGKKPRDHRQTRDAAPAGIGAEHRVSGHEREPVHPTEMGFHLCGRMDFYRSGVEHDRPGSNQPGQFGEQVFEAVDRNAEKEDVRCAAERFQRVILFAVQVFHVVHPDPVMRAQDGCPEASKAAVADDADMLAFHTMDSKRQAPSVPAISPID